MKRTTQDELDVLIRASDACKENPKLLFDLSLRQLCTITAKLYDMCGQLAEELKSLSQENNKRGPNDQLN